MKKIFFVMLVVVTALPAYAGVEFSSGEFKATVYGELYADGTYIYGSDTYTSTSSTATSSALRIGNGQHSFGSMTFVGSSKLGVTMQFKNISGTFEAGLSDAVRRFFLKYNFKGREDHYLLIGRDNNLAYYLFGQITNDGQSLIDYGNLLNRRRLQVRYGIKGFEVAVIIPKIGFNSVSDDKAYTDTETNAYIFPVLPRVEMAYTLKTDDSTIKFFGSYGAYWYKNETASTTVDAFDKVAHMFTVGFGGNTSFGPAFIHYSGFFGQNIYLNSSFGAYYSDTGLMNNKLKPVTMVTDATTGLQTLNITDVYTAGAAFGVGYNFLDGKIVSQAGLGYSASFGPGFLRADDTLGAYINTQFYINSWFSVIPELVLLHDLGGMALNSDGTRRINENQGFGIVAGITAVLTF